MHILSQSSGKIIIFSTTILSLIGLYLSYSIGGVISESYYGYRNYFLINQIYGIALGIIFAFLIVKINYRILLSLRGYIYYILIILQPNITEAVLIFLTGSFLTYLIGNRVLTRTFLFTLASITIILLLTSPNYFHYRILSFIDPGLDPYGLGHQTTRSIVALKNGGLTGSVNNLTTLTMPIIPDANSGFVFSVIGEKYGFIGIEIIVVIYAIFLYGIYITSKIAQNYFGKLLCAGIGFYLTLILVINLGMISGVFPATEITLPFIGYSGITNSVVNYILIALILSVWIHSPVINPALGKKSISYSYNTYLAKSKKIQLSIESNHIFHWLTIISSIAGLVELILRMLWKK